jgi:hypothetical protein
MKIIGDCSQNLPKSLLLSAADGNDQGQRLPAHADLGMGGRRWMTRAKGRMSRSIISPNTHRQQQWFASMI